MKTRKQKYSANKEAVPVRYNYTEIELRLHAVTSSPVESAGRYS